MNTLDGTYLTSGLTAGFLSPWGFPIEVPGRVANPLGFSDRRRRSVGNTFGLPETTSAVGRGHLRASRNDVDGRLGTLWGFRNDVDGRSGTLWGFPDRRRRSFWNPKGPGAADGWHDGHVGVGCACSSHDSCQSRAMAISWK